MKPSSKTKTRLGKGHGSPQPAMVPARRSPLPRWLILGFCLLLTGGGTWALFEYVIWNTLPAELVGKWVVAEGSQEGATFDFFRSGAMIGKVNLGGKEGIINAVIRVEGKNMYSTTQHPQTGRQDTRVQVIRTLTSKELVLEDQQGMLLRMERAD